MVYSSLDKTKVGVRMGAQTQPKLLLAAAFGIIFVTGFFFGNITKYCTFSRLQLKDVSNTGSGTSIDKEAALYVDLSAPDVTLPSIAKTSDKILHEPSSCKATSDLSFVYFIFSVAKQVERRKAIRETWGSLAKPQCGSRVIFVLNVVDGTSETKADMESLQAQVDKEVAEFEDILQFGHIIDSSRTLTNKTKATFEWFLRECPNVPYLAKGEDHTYVNRQDFEKYIVSHSQPEAIFGHRVYKNTVVFRDPKSYFYVAREDYIEETYPEYMISMMYAIPRNIIKTLLSKSAEVKWIPLEDIYWTGMVADYAGVPRNNMERYEYDYIFDRNRPYKCPKKDLIAVRYMPPTEFYKYWSNKCYIFPECTGKTSSEHDEDQQFGK